jgi:hypothetical protein
MAARLYPTPQGPFPCASIEIMLVATFIAAIDRLLGEA